MPRMIAPRLLSGERREGIGHGLPPVIKATVRAIARAENKSVSWVLEEIIIDWATSMRPRTPRPLYLKPRSEKRRG